MNAEIRKESTEMCRAERRACIAAVLGVAALSCASSPSLVRPQPNVQTPSHVGSNVAARKAPSQVTPESLGFVRLKTTLDEAKTILAKNGIANVVVDAPVASLRERLPLAAAISPVSVTWEGLYGFCTFVGGLYSGINSERFSWISPKSDPKKPLLRMVCVDDAIHCATIYGAEDLFSGGSDGKTYAAVWVLIPPVSERPYDFEQEDVRDLEVVVIEHLAVIVAKGADGQHHAKFIAIDLKSGKVARIPAQAVLDVLRNPKGAK
jgi:hypothetical protein